MGATLTRNQSISTSRQVREPQEATATTDIENTNNHLRVTAIGESQQQEKKSKKKKDPKSSKTPVETIKVDKGTNTEIFILPSLLFSNEKLVHDKLPIENNDISPTSGTAQINIAYESETFNRDEHAAHPSILRNVADATHSASSTMVLNDDQVRMDE